MHCRASTDILMLAYYSSALALPRALASWIWSTSKTLCMYRCCHLFRFPQDIGSGHQWLLIIGPIFMGLAARIFCVDTHLLFLRGARHLGIPDFIKAFMLVF